MTASAAENTLSTQPPYGPTRTSPGGTITRQHYCVPHVSYHLQGRRFAFSYLRLVPQLSSIGLYDDLVVSGRNSDCLLKLYRWTCGVQCLLAAPSTIFPMTWIWKLWQKATAPERRHGCSRSSEFGTLRNSWRSSGTTVAFNVRSLSVIDNVF